jgi:hypothetical protein
MNHGDFKFTALPQRGRPAYSPARECWVSVPQTAKSWKDDSLDAGAKAPVRWIGGAYAPPEGCRPAGTRDNLGTFPSTHVLGCRRGAPDGARTTNFPDPRSQLWPAAGETFSKALHHGCVSQHCDHSVSNCCCTKLIMAEQLNTVSPLSSEHLSRGTANGGRMVHRSGICRPALLSSWTSRK